MRSSADTNLMVNLLVILSVSFTLVSSSRMGMVDHPMKRVNYESVLMRDLYKRLLGDEEDGPLDFEEIPNLDYVTDELSREYPEGEVKTLPQSVRDSELIEHSSSLAGNQPVFPAGSALEEALNSEASAKSEESLPFYCPPPNPCPKDYTDKDGCMTDVQDTAEAQKAWIGAMQNAGYCTCDREHMFNCPDVQTLEGPPAVSAQKKASEKAEPVYLTGEKRQTLVAKKSPRRKRSVASSSTNLEHELSAVQKSQKDNPYLRGDKLRTVAKKG